MAAKNKKRVRRRVFFSKVRLILTGNSFPIRKEYISLMRRVKGWKEGDRVRVTVERLPRKKAKGE